MGLPIHSLPVGVGHDACDKAEGAGSSHSLCFFLEKQRFMRPSMPISAIPGAKADRRLGLLPVVSAGPQMKGFEGTIARKAKRSQDGAVGPTASCCLC